MADSDADIVKIIENEIKTEFYKQFSNDGNRFVAWYLKTIYNLPDKDVLNYVTDGKDDKQIDAIYVDDNNETIHIIQGKYYNGRTLSSEPIRECLSAMHQLRNLESLEEKANAKLRNNLLNLNDGLNEGYKVILDFITTGIIPENVLKDAVDVQNDISEMHDITAEMQIVDTTELAHRYEQALGNNESLINQSVQLTPGNYIKMNLSDTNVVVAAIPLTECIRFDGIRDGRLFKKNVRQSLGDNKVNKGMAKTIKEFPEDFFFMHNGITAICKKMVLDENNNVLSLTGLNIVNGCQSMTTFSNNAIQISNRSNAYVLFRFYEIKDDSKADSITKATNSQSPVKPRDLRSIDPNIIKLKKRYENAYESAYLLTKRGEQAPAGYDELSTANIVELGKSIMSWYLQRPNIAYSESKIFDVYFDQIFGRRRFNDNTPENVKALIEIYQIVSSKWEDKKNPLRIDETLFSKPRYMIFHHIYSISIFVAQSNENSNVPNPKKSLDLIKNNDLLDRILRKTATSLNKAYNRAKRRAESKNKAFSVENWMKNNSCLEDISDAIYDIIQDDEECDYKTLLKMEDTDFEQRWDGKE